jgi:hypothetical protein
MRYYAMILENDPRPTYAMLPIETIKPRRLFPKQERLWFLVLLMVIPVGTEMDGHYQKTIRWSGRVSPIMRSRNEEEIGL